MSAIVTTVLLVLIIIIAIIITWTTVVPIISEEIALNEMGIQVNIDVGEGYTFCDRENGVSFVQIARSVNSMPISLVKIIFYVNGSSISSIVPAPKMGEKISYPFNLNNKYPDSIAVAPIFVYESGKLKEGDIMSTVKCPKGTVPKFVVPYDIGEDYYYRMPTNGLIAWWKFDGNLGDSVGENTIYRAPIPPTFTNDGKVGQAYSFNGINDMDDYIRINNSGKLTPEKITYSAWIKTVENTTRPSPHDYNIITESEGYNFPNGGYQLKDDKNRLSLIIALGGAQVILTNTKNLPIGEFTHVAFTYDGDYVKLYQNGNEVASSPNSSGITYAGNDMQWIGCDSHTFNGTIDEVMIWDRALSVEELRALYENQK